MAVKRKPSPARRAARKRAPVASVSVVIPAYNCRKTLPVALASIARQTLRPMEILVCDDGSTDRTWDYMVGLHGEYRGIPLQIFSQKNAGAGAARNRCLAAATGKYVAFLDADDQWLPQKLERSLHWLEDEPSARHPTFVAHDFYAVDKYGNRTHWHCAQNSHRRDWFNKGNPRLHYFYRGFIGILTVVMRRDALVKAGGFHAEDRYGLDWEAWHALMAANPKAHFRVFNEPLALYANHSGGLTAKGLERLREREVHLGRYVKGVGRRNNIAWPLLYLRGWVTLQYEAMHALARAHQPERLAYVIARAPFALVRNLCAITFGKPYRRPNFLKALRG